MNNILLTEDAADAIETSLALKSSEDLERRDYDGLVFKVINVKGDKYDAHSAFYVEVESQHVTSAGEEAAFEWAREQAAAAAGESRFFCLRFDRLSNSPAWALIHWMPKQVREDPTARALENVARQTVSEALASLRPKGGGEVCEFACRDLGNLTRAALVNSIEGGGGADCITRGEALLKRLGKPHRAYSRVDLSALPVHEPNRLGTKLTETPKAAERLQKFADSTQEAALGLVIDETTSVMQTEDVQAFGGSLSNLVARLHQRQPRYYIIRYHGTVAFILWCPEGSSKRLRFLYAACKEAAAKILLQHGVRFATVSDVRSSAALEKVFVDDAQDWTPHSALFSIRLRPPHTTKDKMALSHMKTVSVEFCQKGNVPMAHAETMNLDF